jgi:hypothetical protein
MDRPDAAQVREWATGNDGLPTFDFARYGYGDPPPGDPDALERVVAQAIAYVEWATGRTLDASLTAPGLVALAQDAVLMRTEQILVGRGNSKAVRTALGKTDLASMRAGDYSETRRAPADAIKAGLVNSWAELNDTLRALALPERWAELLAELGGKPRAVGLVVETGEPAYGYE